MNEGDTCAQRIDAKNDLPLKLLPEGNCQWMQLDGKRFTEPFFDETIMRCLAVQPREVKKRTTYIDEMLEMGQQLPPVKPAAIIFHISRCGSTLAAQAFATSGRFILLSEVPFFDDIIRWPLHNAELSGHYDTKALFEAALRFYGMKRRPAEEHLIIKTDAWHIFYYDILRNMFADTPFILMYRNPAEVLRSLLKKPGMQILPDLVQPEIFGLPGVPELYQMAGYSAVIMEKLLGKFMSVAGADPNVTLISYSEGPIAIVERIAASAGFKLSDEEWSAIVARVQYSSKQPGELFSRELPAEVPECIEPAMALYEMLEVKRKSSMH